MVALAIAREQVREGDSLSLRKGRMSDDSHIE